MAGRDVIQQPFLAVPMTHAVRTSLLQTPGTGFSVRPRLSTPRYRNRSFLIMASSAPPPIVSVGSAQEDQTLSSRKETLRRMYEESQKAFPAVQDITCNQLQDLLQASDPVILVDVRSPDEQQVSVLPGNVVRKEDFDGHQQEYANHKIVTYCTIGARSGKYAQQLVDQGVPQVYNLRGSIIAWTQEGYPLVKGDNSQTGTTQVHTFGKQWDLVGDGYQSIQYGAIQGNVELVRSVLPRVLGGR